MLPIQIARLAAASSGGGGGGGGGGSALDEQTLTTGADGAAIDQDRRRGFISATIGSLSDGTSDIFAGASYLEMYWDEGAGGGATYNLRITGATNTGWTTMLVDGVAALTRAGAASFGSNRWVWNTSDSASSQLFGANGSVHTIEFV